MKCFSLLFALVALLVCSACSSHYSYAPVSSSKKLAEQIRTIKPWGETNEYTTGDWLRVIKAAKTLQRCSATCVEAALDEVLAVGTNERLDKLEEERKIVILIRVAFDLPQEAEKKYWYVFRGWLNANESARADGKCDLSWPVGWSGDQPYLISRCEGVLGGPYDATGEYRYLRQRYPYRNLENAAIAK